jgi:hypothetical protein
LGALVKRHKWRLTKEEVKGEGGRGRGMFLPDIVAILAFGYEGSLYYKGRAATKDTLLDKIREVLEFQGLEDFFCVIFDTPCVIFDTF